LAKLLRGDLDWITIKAVEKERGRRYGTPAELAADIKRYLENRPVVARPASTGYRYDPSYSASDCNKADCNKA
jgi:hypothetical protein